MISRNLIGPLPLALAGLAKEHHGLVLDIVNRLKDEGTDDTHRRLAAALREKPLLNAESVPVSPPTPTLIFLKQVMLGSTGITVYQLGKRLTFAQMFRAVLNIVDDDITVDGVALMLKKRKHTLTAAQLDAMIEKQEKFFKEEEGGEDMGLRTDGWWNFVPVEDENGRVSVVGVIRDNDWWYRRRNSLADGRLWDREDRLVVSNSDASNL